MALCYVCREEIKEKVAIFCGNLTCPYRVHFACALQMMQKRSRRCGCGKRIDIWDYRANSYKQLPPKS